MEIDISHNDGVITVELTDKEGNVAECHEDLATLVAGQSGSVVEGVISAVRLATSVAIHYLDEVSP